MEIKEILSKLEYNTGKFPYEAVRAAIKKKDEIIPEFLKILESTKENIDIIKKEPDYFAHIFSMFLLAQFREKRAYPLIIKIFSHSGDTAYYITGDIITEDLPQILSSVCHGHITLIKELIENHDLDEFVRGAGLRALVTLVVNGIKTREEIMDYFKSLFRGKLEKKPSHVWDSLVDCSCDLCPKEVYEDIVKSYQECLVERDFIQFDEVKESLKMSWEKNLERLKKSSHHKLIDDTIKCMEWWACFQTKKKLIVKPKPKVEKPPIKKWKQKKIGRNQPCPCGSGKKYKKCHWTIDKGLKKHEVGT